MQIQDIPSLKNVGALPVDVPAPDLTRTPPVVGTPPRIPVIFMTENGQISIGTGTGNNGATEPNSASAFEVQSTIGLFCPPKMTTAQRNAINIDVASAGIIWNTTTGTLDLFNGTSWKPSGKVVSVTGSGFASVDNTDPQNPVVSVLTSEAAAPNTIVRRDADAEMVGTVKGGLRQPGSGDFSITDNSTANRYILFTDANPDFKIRMQSTHLGFYGVAPVTRASIVGPAFDEATFLSVLAALKNLGLIDY